MSHTVAAHYFNTIVHGERCVRPNCQGEGRLSVLIRDVDTYASGQKDISHYGVLTDGEIAQIMWAKEQIDKRLSDITRGFGRG